MSEQNAKVVREDLNRGLQERHIQLISFGGAIGVGLFLGSASAIEKAGPAVVVAYIICGLAIFFVMRAMGEVVVEYPVSGSFSAHAYQFLNPLAGYISGWNYWYFWIVTCMAEITAVGVYMHFWYPDLPQWISCLAALAIMTCANLISVKAYGEFEFWFALIKIITIIFLIITGGAMIFFGFGNNGVAVGLSNLTAHGGFFPNGFGGMISAMCVVAAAFQGVELVGITAGEAQNPKETLRKATKNIVWRILIFYIGAIFVVITLYPWDELGMLGSPFVTTFAKVGVTSAAGIINFVVLTAALSGCNSGIYSSGRMLYTLAENGQAPKFFGKLSSHGVPQHGIMVTLACLLFGVVLNYLIPDSKLFLYIYSASVFPGMVAWFVLAYSQKNFRKRWGEKAMAEHPFKSPLFPYANYFCLIFLVLVTIGMWVNPDTRMSLIAGWTFMIIVTAGYFLAGYRKNEYNEDGTLKAKH
jgi:AAT family amino acid transporter